MSIDWEHIPAKHRQLIKAFLDEADMSADAIKTVDFPPAYGADIVVSCEKAKDPKWQYLLKTHTICTWYWVQKGYSV